MDKESLLNRTFWLTFLLRCFLIVWYDPLRSCRRRQTMAQAAVAANTTNTIVTVALPPKLDGGAKPVHGWIGRHLLKTMSLRGRIVKRPLRGSVHCMAKHNGKQFQ